jgi:hypothetical protein
LLENNNTMKDEGACNYVPCHFNIIFTSIIKLINLIRMCLNENNKVIIGKYLLDARPINNLLQNMELGRSK